MHDYTYYIISNSDFELYKQMLSYHVNLDVWNNSISCVEYTNLYHHVIQSGVMLKLDKNILVIPFPLLVVIATPVFS